MVLVGEGRCLVDQSAGLKGAAPLIIPQKHWVRLLAWVGKLKHSPHLGLSGLNFVCMWEDASHLVGKNKCYSINFILNLLILNPKLEAMYCKTYFNSRHSEWRTPSYNIPTMAMCTNYFSQEPSNSGHVPLNAE